MTSTGTRTVVSYGQDQITIVGLTKGPASGWTWNGSTLAHPTGIRLRMDQAAAARITAAVAAYQPATTDIRTALQVNALPAAARVRYELECLGTAGDDPVDDEHLWKYVRRTAPVAGRCEFRPDEVLEMGRG